MLQTIKGFDSWLTKDETHECTCKHMKCKDPHCACKVCNEDGYHLGHTARCLFPQEDCECDQIEEEDFQNASDKMMDYDDD